MTDTAVPYALEDLTHECERAPCPFTDFDEDSSWLCTETSETRGQTGQIDVEAEARMVFEGAYAEGEKAGFEMGMQKLEPVAKRLTDAIAECASFQRRLREKAEQMATVLALTFAETIVLKECEAHREIILEMAKKALELVDEKSNIVIRMRREDMRFVAVDETSGLTIVPDDGLKEPGFIIETQFGDIDGRISIQFAELGRQMLFSPPDL
jgi:flagellar biosynthesis/type III secretory pathway protein FliH